MKEFNRVLEKSSKMLAKLMKWNSELKLAIVKVEPYAVELATAWRSCYSFKGAPVFLLVYDIFASSLQESNRLPL